jgi:hypothetical protein
MADTKSLREAIEKQLAACEFRLEQKRREVDAAQNSVSRLESELAMLRVDAEKRIAAIRLVEEMLRDADREAGLLPYRDMNQEEAMRRAILRAERPLNSSELADALTSGGYTFTSTNPANSIVVAANTNRKGYFVTEKEGNRTLIGLAEWGPENEPSNPFDHDVDDRKEIAQIR